MVKVIIVVEPLQLLEEEVEDPQILEMVQLILVEVLLVEK